MKKWMLALLAMLLTLMCTVAAADVSGDWKYWRLPDGTVEITYRYQPPLLMELSDEPQLPEGMQGLLVEYAAARERSRFDAASQNAARLDLTLYRELKGKLKRNYPAQDLSRIYNVY